MPTAPRLYCPGPLQGGAVRALPAGAARHAQVLRLQPGDALVLFDGSGGEWDACIARMGRSEVLVETLRHRPVEREAARRVHLAAACIAAERMDWLIEKATELGAVGITPILAARSAARFGAERAERRLAHWRAIAQAACEQCGRNRLPRIEPISSLGDWLAALAGRPATGGAPIPLDTPDPAPGDAVPGTDAGPRLLLSLAPGATALGAVAAQATRGTGAVTLLSGPEGGFSPDEEAAAQAAGFQTVTLGERVLRAETAPLAALAALTLL
ncbi:MAG: 16S rRNA (uracil(1498)-N(3))-methyltransferase [Proteobacteria bacterium]|nr:16S rRNA (uracil(1498)-N(3))-methyltransferase [Pseudomonadota bacterium]